MTDRLRPRNLAIAGGVLLLIAVVLLLLLNSTAYLDIPAKAQPLAPLVQVTRTKRHVNGGGIYYVAVTVRRASLLEKLLPPIRPSGSTLTGGLEPCTSDAQETQAELLAMKNSQQTAEAVAYRRLGLKVGERPIGLRVEYVDPGSHAVCKLRYADIIVGADGRSVTTYAALHRIIAGHKPGDVARITFDRGDRREIAAIKTLADPRNHHHALLGIILQEAYSFHLPRHAQFDLGRVGGPSAGLAFALELLEKYGRNVDHGYRVAATGELEPDGSVVEIGGIKQKVLGARQAHVDVFVVPVDNAAAAKRYAHGLRIIAVKSFQQALQKLATLPRKR